MSDEKHDPHKWSSWGQWRQVQARNAELAKEAARDADVEKREQIAEKLKNPELLDLKELGEFLREAGEKGLSELHNLNTDMDELRRTLGNLNERVRLVEAALQGLMEPVEPVEPVELPPSNG